ncbi:alpha-L-fucosidase [Fusarium pseudocircinatum]|uniref:alpha-L-fucosidase n=1 Tax=Fusarium pseudocircinatum TaxID=56676 RepID=A0A8H5PVF4_9HYPO|nr:alpha-L-fucosidase [Fusarium pseudocircinatum]
MKVQQPHTLLTWGLIPTILAKPTGPYQPTWESTDKHTASPEWFRDAKFGVYWHWGAFTTPQYGSEWYPRNMYFPGDVRTHHEETYGPLDKWGYQNFILGSKDLKGNHVQFKPILAADGGHFDPIDWMEAIKGSGAKFAGPVAEHHDGFSMWNSQVNQWNSVRLGPKLDLVPIFAELVRHYDMKFMVAMHTAFNFNGYYVQVPKQNSTSLQKLFGQLPTNVENKLWFEKQREVIDLVQPDIIWNDVALDSPGWCLTDTTSCSVEESQRLKFLAYYFNKGVEWGKDVLTTYKDYDHGFHDTSAVMDFERGGPADITRPYWLTDDAISATSWSYTDGIEYYNAKQMIHSLLDRVSKNGNMLLNISPTAAGILPQAQKDVLSAIGSFLKRYGEAVYDTRAWNIYGEGPTKAGGGSFVKPMEGTDKDLRFTRSKQNDILYVFVLGWPSDKKMSIASLGSDSLVDLSSLKSVQLLGDSAQEYTAVEAFKQENDGLVISLPDQPKESVAYVVKLTFDGKIPVPQPTLGAAVFTGKNSDIGITLGEGKFKAIFLSEAGIEPGDITFLRVSNGTVARSYVKEDITGDATTYGVGEHEVPTGSIGSIAIERA